MVTNGYHLQQTETDEQQEVQDAIGVAVANQDKDKVQDPAGNTGKNYQITLIGKKRGFCVIPIENHSIGNCETTPMNGKYNFPGIQI